MSTFAVILNEPSAEVERRIRDAYPPPNHYAFSATVYLVAGDLLVDDIIETVGIGEDSGAAGFVVRLNHGYGGWTNRGIWDWFARAEELKRPRTVGSLVGAAR